jgi:hypothetical protein
MLNVIMLSVVMPSVVAPSEEFAILLWYGMNYCHKKFHVQSHKWQYFFLRHFLAAGFEPSASGLPVHCSTTVPPPLALRVDLKNAILNRFSQITLKARQF